MISIRLSAPIAAAPRLAAVILAVAAPAAWAPAVWGEDGPGRAKIGTWGVDLTSLDRSVKPGDDFFAYAEGAWLKTAQIAPDKTGAGYAYDLPDLAERDVRAIAEDAARATTTPAERRIADVYAAWMDAPGIEARGLAPLKPYLARIDAVASVGDLARLMVEPGFAGPVGLGVSPDPRTPTVYAVFAGQASLGLPARDYYLLPGAKYEAIRAAYRAYIATLLGLLGDPDAGDEAGAILALETRLAHDQWTPERSRDALATYNPMDRVALAALAPQFDWPATLAHAGFGAVPTVIVEQPSAVAAAGRALAESPLAVWKRYLRFRFVSDHAQFLPRAFDEANFAFYGRTLNDTPEQSERWKRGVRLLNDDLGEAVGEIYVQSHWGADTERPMAELLADLRASYGERIRGAAWMDAPTRKAALEKLATFEPRVGHPVKYLDYESMTVSRTDPLANAVAAEVFEDRLWRTRLAGPVDRGLWDMTPQTVNAYYDASQNQVTFPAAILQPPFFDSAADPAVNYGETGATIGHEMGHGFDDQGRHYDAQGRLRDWWTPAAADRYTAHAQVLVRQFDAYEPIPGVHIKGELTLGENLGDLGGLEAAYGAWRLYVARHGAPPVIDGFTGDQRFFLAYAQSWQGKVREGALRAQLLSDPHSPEAYRVNGVVRNLDAWYAAFNVRPGDRLYLPPADRVRVW
jgi:endothelin-converting enzyme/putative endopeptidase